MHPLACAEAQRFVRLGCRTSAACAWSCSDARSLASPCSTTCTDTFGWTCGTWVSCSDASEAAPALRDAGARGVLAGEAASIARPTASTSAGGAPEPSACAMALRAAARLNCSANSKSLVDVSGARGR